MPKASGWHRKVRGPADVVRQRKYDSAEHKAAKAHLRILVAGGRASCWRCGKTLVPGQWHVGHDDVNTLIIRGGECARECNLKAAARKGALIANANRKRKRLEAAFVRPVR